MAVEPADRAVVERQIGRPARGLEAVEARCVHGFPAVVSVRPVVEGRRGPEPFPSRFWLTCPALVEDISRVEAAGGVRALEAEMAADAALREAVADDHRRCADERWRSLDPAGRAAAERAGHAPVLRDSGDRAHLKCLHAHYAFHRARGGAVGALLDRRHAPRECPGGAVRCAAPADPVPDTVPDPARR
jgi:hypothetical protein